MSLAALVRAAALAVVFALAALGSAIVHLGLPAPRRFVQARVNGALAGAFAGRITVVRLARLGVDRVAGVDVEVVDPEGERVLDLHGLRARLDLAALLRSLARRGPVAVRVTDLGIDDAEALIEQDAAGEVGLLRAFSPRTAKGPASLGEPSRRAIDLAFPDVHLRHAWIHGHLSGVPPLDARLDGLEGAVRSSPASTTAEVEALVNQHPVRAAGSLHGSALAASVHAGIGAGEVTASGTATLPRAPREALVATAQVEATGLDLSLLHADAPRSRLTAALEASVTASADGELAGTFALESQAGEVRDQAIPAARVRGELTRQSVRGSAELAEPGAPTTVQFALGPDRLALQVDTSVPDLAAVPRLGPLGRGRAHLVAEGDVALDTHEIAASASLAVADLDVEGVQLARGVVTGSAEGTLASPRFVARLLGAGVRAGGYPFSRVRASASGSPRALDLDAEIAADDRAATVAARAHLTTSTRGAHLDGAVVATLAGAGTVEIHATDVAVHGPATDPASWRTATGTLALHGAVDLARLLAQLPAEARPVASASGRLTLHGGASRPLTGGASVAIEGSTEGLAIVAGRAKQPWRVAGLDGSFALKAGGLDGRAQLEASLHDRLGKLASLTATAIVPLDEMSWDRLLARASETPVTASLVVPRRSLGALPPALGASPLAGDVALAVEMRGTARAPHLTLTAKGTHLRPRRAASAPRADLEARVTYDGEVAGVRLTARGDGRALVDAGADVRIVAAQALAGGDVAWDASGDVAIADFPLEAAGALLGKPLGGSVSGEIAFRDLHRAASLTADLDVRRLTLSRTTFPRGALHVTVAEGALAATARLDQADGYAETGVTGAVRWGAELAPRFDAARPVDLTLRAQNFRADAAMPFVQGALTELDGRVDADARIRVEPGGKDGRMSGAVVLRDGVFEVPQLGERFHAACGRLRVEPWGTIRVEDFSAAASRGRLTASAEAVVDGLALRRAVARVHVARGESIPVTVADVPVGQAYGDVTARAQMSPDGARLDLEVAIPTLQLELLRSTGRAVQSLDPDPTIRAGVHRGAEFVLLPLAPPRRPRAPSGLAVHVAVVLGDVGVSRDTTVQLAIRGRVFVDLGDEVRVTGRLDLERGKLDLQGKRFIIDRGTVSFVGGDPANPMVVATAYWDAPDGTRVFADFSGYVKDGTLSLRADPPLGQDEILALLLFGSPEGGSGAEGSTGPLQSTGIRVAGLAGGLLAQALNKAISGVTSDVTVRVDTSQAANPRPELVVQLSRRVTARLAYSLGVPAPGEDPDRAALTLDWRFDRDWSLVAVVGDQGSTSLDVLWRLRY